MEAEATVRAEVTEEPAAEDVLPDVTPDTKTTGISSRIFSSSLSSSSLFCRIGFNVNVILVKTADATREAAAAVEITYPAEAVAAAEATRSQFLRRLRIGTIVYVMKTHILAETVNISFISKSVNLNFFHSSQIILLMRLFLKI